MGRRHASSLLESREYYDTRFDRSHFAAPGAASLDFATAYYVRSADYNGYMDIQQVGCIASSRIRRVPSQVKAMPERRATAPASLDARGRSNGPAKGPPRHA